MHANYDPAFGTSQLTVTRTRRFVDARPARVENSRYIDIDIDFIRTVYNYYMT